MKFKPRIPEERSMLLDSVKQRVANATLEHLAAAEQRREAARNSAASSKRSTKD